MLYTSWTFNAVLALIFCFTGSAQAKTCAEDRCLKRVQHQASGNPQPRSECGQFFLATYYPAASTTTKTTTKYTAVVGTTRNLTKYEVKTSSSTVTIPVYVRTTTTSQPLSRTTFQKRSGGGPSTAVATKLPSDVRGFCANTAAYSSACSCIGAKHSTATADRRTITVTKTVTYTNTVDAFTTVTTTTIYTPEFTSHVTYTTATRTVTTGTATPIACPQPQPTFQLRVYRAQDYYYHHGQVGEYAGITEAPVFDGPALPDYIKGRMTLVEPGDAANFTRAADCTLVSLEPGDTFGLYGNAFKGDGDFLYFGKPKNLPADIRVRIGFASDSDDVYMEADTNGKVLNTQDCIYDYFLGQCDGVTMNQNAVYGFAKFEKILQ